jgi:hypothetical protein
MQVAAMETEEKRAKKKGQDVEDSTVSVRGWGRIKLLNKRLQNLKIDLSSKGINIVSVAQSEEIKEKRGENFVVVGKKPNMAKGIQFDYDIVLQLFTEKDMNGIEIYKALVEKDRTGVYHKGDIIENPSYDNWKSYVEANAELHERPVTFNKDTDKDMKKMETESEKLDEVIATFKEKMKGLAKENQVKVAKKIKELGIENPLKTDNLDGMIEVIDFIEKL